MATALIACAVLVLAGAVFNLARRSRQVEERLTDLEMGRPVKVTDPPRQVQYLRQDR